MKFLKVKKVMTIALAATMFFTPFGIAPVMAQDVSASETSSEIAVNEAGIWFETAFAVWTGDINAKYEVYVKGDNVIDWRDGSPIPDFLTDWTLVNDEANAPLVRVVDPARNTWRADIPGLPEGAYEIQVRFDGKVIHRFSNLQTEAFPRNGAAFVPSNENPYEGNHDFALDGAIGGYLPDGRVNPAAKIVYITPETATQYANSLFNDSSRGSIANQKQPLIVRFVGTITGRGASIGAGNGNVTIEGIGPDATLSHGPTLIGTGGAHNVVIQNMNFDYWTGDAVEIHGGGTNQRASNIWVHNNTFGYGQNLHLANAADPDQAKGDGALDIVNHARNYTVAYNHFAGSSKVMLIGGGAGSISEHYGTIHHNWFQGTEERTPRVRNGRVHVYNNLFEDVQGHPYHDTLLERNTGYGIGAAHNATIWAEGNIFDNVNFPFLRSRQGHARGSQDNGFGIDLPNNSPNAGFNHFFGDAPGYIVAREAVFEGDFPETMEGFRLGSDVKSGMTQADLDALRADASQLEPNVLDAASSKNFNVKEDIGIVVASDSTTQNPNMTTSPASQLDWAFRPSRQGVWPTGTADFATALRTEIQTNSGSQSDIAPVSAPAAPEITDVRINEEVRSAFGTAHIPAPGKIIVHEGTFTIDWANNDVLTENYELQLNTNKGGWVTLAEIAHNTRAKSFITHDIDQFANLNGIFAKAENGGMYQFRIRALNAAGASEWSDVVVVDTVETAVASAVVNKLRGNQNELAITIDEVYADGTGSGTLTETILIKNNAEGIYRVGRYDVFVNTKGNTKVLEIYIVE
ncbi:pectate lyase family protein [Bacillus sp. JJ1562]|uniref:pectate lyase family protein n=1 Tax=Bacillus sp. JJ1562 TaxID=3122960 RepID=UPI00300290E5